MPLPVVPAGPEPETRMTQTTTQMRREIAEIPAAVERLLADGAAPIAEVGSAIRKLDPRVVVTVARGTSDHACTVLKYAAETLLGVPVASLGPSVASIYGTPMRLDGALCLAISQSGKSPDIVEMARAARAGGARTVSITNTADSPLAQGVDYPLDMLAGPEIAVAATKTFVASVVSALMLLADWGRQDELRAALNGLPRALDDAIALDWPELRSAIGAAPSMFTLGRGPCLAISNEAALKFKETCGLHAESYSAAEVLHGPVAIVSPGFPVLAFAAGDAAEDGLAEVADRIADMGGNVFATSAKVRKATELPHIRTGNALTDTVALIVSFYSMVERLAVERGIDPDTPRNLRKVTETV